MASWRQWRWGSALGELLIVFVGILGAVQVDRWNEGRKERAVLQDYLDRIIIDVSRAHIWDISSVQALDMATFKFRRDGAQVEIIGMNDATETIVDKLTIRDKPGAMDKLMAH